MPVSNIPETPATPAVQYPQMRAAESQDSAQQKKALATKNTKMPIEPGAPAGHPQMRASENQERTRRDN